MRWEARDKNGKVIYAGSCQQKAISRLKKVKDGALYHYGLYFLSCIDGEWKERGNENES
jgi:hypothetical protein